MDDPLGGWGAYVQESAEAERAAKADVDTRPGEWRNIWVYAEIREDHVRASTYELIGRARELAESLGARVGALLLGPAGVGAHADALIKAGADTVYLAQSPLFDRQDIDLTASALVRLVRERRPELLVIGQSTFGDALAGRVAIALDTGAVARVSDITVDTSERLFVFHQNGYEGRVEKQARIPKNKPQVATVLRRSFQRPMPDPTRSGRIVEIFPEVGPDDMRLRATGAAPPAPEVPLAQAPVVVLCGKGIGGRDGFEQASRLTQVLHGARMAVTRSVADLDYGPRELLVGLQGTRIQPVLLITLGVSGDLDTLEGVDRTRLRTWIAVDRDPEANILAEADIAVVSEWQPFVEELTRTLKAEKRALAFE